MSIVNLAEGSIFAGRYKVVRSIAAGGMGAVYEVLHVGTARRRALKVMHPHLEQSDDFRKRFEAEARIAGQVESAYIVDVFDAGVDEATKMPFLVMELLKGEELGKRLRRVGKFEFQECVGYLWQTALARKLCGSTSTCRVLAWASAAQIPATFPLPREARASLLFSYTRDPAGSEIALYDCSRIGGVNRDQCIPRAR